MDWYLMKMEVVRATGLNMDALHVHVGVLAQILMALVLRVRLSSPWPWLLLLAATLANEWWDLAYEIWPTRDEQYAESVKDVWNTMLLPTVLLALARWAPGLFGSRPRVTEDASG
jgi:hypothetical protein